MNNIWVLFKNNLYVSVVKKKSTFLLGLIAPLVVLFAMGKILSFSGGYINIGVVDKDNSNTSKAIIEFVESAGVFNVIDLNESEIDGKFSEKSIDGSVYIPKGFEDGLLKSNDIKVTIKGKENDGIDKMLSDILYSEVSNLKNLAKASENNKENYLELIDKYKNNGEVKIQKEALSDLKSDYLIANIFVGFVIFFMLLRGSNGSVHYYDEKRENVFNRFFMAPIKSYEYYLADLLSNYVVVLVQALVGVIGIKVLGTNMGVSSIELFTIMSAIGLVSVAMAICIRSFCKTYSEFGMIYNFTTMILTMVGGCFVPIEMLPKMVDNISYLTPTRWAMEAMYDLQLGLGFGKVIPYILIMLLFAVVFFVIGAYKTAKSEKEFSVA